MSPRRPGPPGPRRAAGPPRCRRSVGLSLCLSLFQELQQQKRPEEPQVQGGREALQQVLCHLGSGECRAEPRGTQQTSLALSLALAPSLSLASSLSLSPSQSLVSSLSLSPSLSPSPALGAPRCSWSHGGPSGCHRTSFPFKLLYLPCLPRPEHLHPPSQPLSETLFLVPREAEGEHRQEPPVPRTCHCHPCLFLFVPTPPLQCRAGAWS